MDRICKIALCASAALAASPVWAAESAVQVEELIVTAQKRAESLQSVPGAVSALGEEALRDRGINTVQDLQYQTPGFQAGTGFNTTTVFIRGVGQTINASQPGVAFHVDGVYQTRPWSAALGQADVARIEILRGPQGTLYGRNATAGAVNVVTNAPTDRFEGSALASYGSYETSHLQAVLNAPLGERLRTRFVVDYADQNKGFIRNVVPGNPDLGAQQTLNGRLRLQYDITDGALLDLVVFGMHQEGGGDYLVLRNRPTAAAIANNPYLAGMNVPLAPRRTSADRKSSRDADAHGATATLSFDLGGMQLKSITGFYRYDYENDFDADGTQLAVTPTINRFSSRTFSQEVNLSARTGDLEWLVGGYLLDDKLSSFVRYDFPLGLFTGTVRLAPNAQFLLSTAPAKTKAYAGFVDGTYHLTERLRLLGGARYSHEDLLTVQTNQAGPIRLPTLTIPVATTCPSRVADIQFESFTPRGGVQYDLDAAASRNVYATVSKGFKSGGVNASGCGQTFRPEKLLAYEAGLKSKLLDGRLTFNVSAFYYDYSDFQMSQIQGLAAMIINAPKATVKGLEVETVWALDDHWTINANASLLKSTYGVFSNTDSLNVAAGVQNLKGNYLNYSPKASGNLGVQYAQDVAIGRVTARADLYLTSKFYFREFNGPLDGQDGYGRLNLTLIWDSPDERYRVRGFATNVTGEDYLSTMGTSDNFGARFVNWAPPRQYGVEVSARF